jgi:hypothetical protein
MDAASVLLKLWKTWEATMVVNLQEYQEIGIIRPRKEGHGVEEYARHTGLRLPGYSNVFRFRHPRDLSLGSLAAEEAQAAHLPGELERAAVVARLM